MRVVPVAALLGLLAVSFSRPAAAQADTTALPDTTAEDVIHLKAGGTLRGRIIESLTTRAGLLIRTRDGRDVRIAHDQIARVQRAARPTPPPAGLGAAPTQGDQELRRMARREPGLAWGLSFLVPGAGQYYNGEFVKGAGFMAAQIATAGIYLNTRDCGDDSCQTATLALGLMMVNWIASQVDAVASASAINRRHGLSLEVAPQPHRLGVSIAALRF